VNAPKHNGDEAERLVDMQMAVIAHHQASAIVHPGETALNLPALTVACARSDGTAALRGATWAAGKGRDSGLDAPPPQLLAQRRTVVILVKKLDHPQFSQMSADKCRQQCCCLGLSALICGFFV
jgi:hypothetical protein